MNVSNENNEINQRMDKKNINQIEQASTNIVDKSNTLITNNHGNQLLLSHQSSQSTRPTQKSQVSSNIMQQLDERKTHLLNLSLNFSSYTSFPVTTPNTSNLLKLSLGSPLKSPSNLIKDITSQSTSLVTGIATEVSSLVAQGALDPSSTYVEPEIPEEAVKQYIKIISQLKKILNEHHRLRRKENLNELRMKAENLEKALKNIPSIYFDQPLDKELLISEIADQQGRALNLYQEKLVYWLEQIEGLVTQRLRMDYLEIIEVLLKVYNLNSDVQEMLDNIQEMKNFVNKMQRTFVYDRMHLLKLSRRKKNLDLIRSVTEKIELYFNLQETLQISEDSNQYLLFFTTYNELDNILTNNQNLKMFEGKLNEFKQRRNVFFEKMVSEFKRLIQFPPIQTSKQLKNNNEDTQDKLENDPLVSRWKNNLYSILLAFVDMDIIDKYLDESKTTFLENLKSSFMEVTNSSLSFVQKSPQVDAEGPKISQETLAQQLAKLEHQHYMFLLHQVLVSSLQFLKQSQMIDDFMLDYFPQQKSYFESPMFEKVLNMSFSRLAVLFSMRSQYSLQKYELIELSYKISNFQDMFLKSVSDKVTDSILEIKKSTNSEFSGTKFIIETFHTYLQTQSKIHFKSFHEKRIIKLEQALENDTWNIFEEIDSRTQSILKCIEVLATEQSDIYSNTSRSIISNLKEKKSLQKVNDNPTEIEKNSKKLGIGNSEFIVCKSFIILVEACWELIEHVSDKELRFLLNPEQISDGLSQFIRTYNDISKQLVLQARAVKTVDIQRITAKHLVVCSESLHALLTLVPYLRKIASQLLNRSKLNQNKSDLILINYQITGTNVLDAYDNLYVSIAEHRDQIVKKLENIMFKRLNNTSEAWKQLKWDTNEVVVPTIQMVSLLKDMAHLHKILSSNLGHRPEEVQRLFTPIVNMYYNQLELCIQTINISSEGWKKLNDDVSLIRKNVEKWKSSLDDSFEIHKLEAVLKKYSNFK